MEENIFLSNTKPIKFEDYLQFNNEGRSNLGGELPVLIYRLLEYSIKDELIKCYGKDALTEIGNRYYFHEKATQLLNNKKRLVFCYCDLDHLKYINDKYGHTEGDYYIQDFVSTVKQFINTDDIFARLGGDEFCIIFSECTYRQAKSEIDEIQHIFAHDKSKIYHKNFSCGILEIPADHEEVSISDIIKQVDKIMYQQKKEHYSSKTDFV